MPPGPDPLEELRARLRATQDAAERIAGRVPPQGWASAQQREETAGEIQALVSMLGALRDLVPEDIWELAREVIRQLLLLLRAILDLAVERLGGGGQAAAPARRVEDIPIR